MVQFKKLRRLIGLSLAPGIFVAGSLPPFAAEYGSAEERVQRSTADVRVRLPDELDRPRNKERWSHRGYEVRTNQFIVVANTRVEDARWASQQMEAAWADFERLADAWMTAHRQPDFGIGAVQVFIDGNTPKDRDLPRTTLNVVGIQTQITLYVAPGQPKLTDQLYRLRKGAGEAFLHTAELDRQLPPWACDGLASYVAAEGLSAEDVKASEEQDKAPGAPRLAGQQWRFQRGEQDRLHMPAMDHEGAAQQVKFLLTADDAAHASDFLAAIKASMAAVQQRRVQGSLVTARRGEEQLAEPGPLDHLAASLERPFEQWQKAPLAGQPKLILDENSPAEVQRVEREMAVVLKLARRFAMPQQGAVHARITAFDKEKGMTVLSRSAENTPAPLPEIYQRLVAPQQPLWGTLDADGKLVLSTDRPALQKMFGLAESRYHWEKGEGRSVLTTSLDGKWKVQGWLEANQDDQSRPLAKFTATKLPNRH